ncbi:acyltransferase family protein [Maricaulis sp.]|uniref:acyltransferase family protein n=1 Tax=Maricaulis sp. TaxID=1486257 RepID=UPI00260947B9|nr:acyltransferase family protein [Maricaulis sp.]
MSDTAANPDAVFTRRYDLDWLRIVAFGLLILYHVGMFFVPWDWHVKSAQANPGPQYAMMLLNPWRLALLFFISGVAIRFLSDKLGAGRFALDRTWRLLPVIVFGMLVVVMPQTWAELRQAGEIGEGLWAFWPRYITSGEIGGVIVPTWNHLWYVVYLFVYCLILSPFIPLLRRVSDGPVAQSMRILDGRGWGLVLLLIVPSLPFWAYRIWLEPHFPATHNLVWDWANHAHRLTILLIGYGVAKQDVFWRAVDRILPFALIYSALYAAALWWGIGRPAGDWEGQAWLSWIFRLARITYAWAIILALLGLARRYLSGDGPVRRYLTEAIFPFYILHQTITVLTGYWIAPMGLNVWVEFAVLVFATGAGCWLGFEIVRRIPVLRPVMGLKWQAAPRALPRRRQTA